MATQAGRKHLHRFGAFMHERSAQRMDEMTAATGLAKGSLLELLVLGMTNEQIVAAAEIGKKVRDTYPDGRSERGSTMAKLRRLPKEKLDELLKLAEEQPQ